MKKILLSVLFLCMLGCIAEAKEDDTNMTGQIVMKINNSKAFVNTLETIIDYNDNSATPMWENSVIYAPVRFIVQHSNGRVIWNQENNTVSIDRENSMIQLSINSNTAIIANEKIELKYQPKLINGRTYMEINDLAGLLEYFVVVENDFIVLGKKATAGNIPKIDALEKMYYEYPTTYGDLYPIYKIVAVSSHGAVGNIGFIDKNGTVVIEPTRRIANGSHYFSRGLYCTSEEIINEDGKVLYRVPHINIAKAYPPKDGIISILNDYPLAQTDALPIYLDMQFRDITDLVKGKDFNSGLNIFKKDGLLYAENKSGNVVIEFPNGVQSAQVVTAPVSNVSNEPLPKSYLLFVQMGKAGIMSLDGTILLEPKYDRIKLLADDIFAVYENGKVTPSIIDSTGQPVFSLNDIEVAELKDDLAIVKNNSRVGVLKTNNTAILDFNYEKIVINNGLILAQKDGNFQIFSNEGVLLFNTDDTDMSFVYDLIYFKNDKKSGYMDYHFNIVYEW